MPEPPAPLPDGSILLHIGPHKTGTTAIQSTLAPAREELAEHGVTYPGQRGAHHPEAHSVRGYQPGWARSSAPAPPKELWQEFAGKVAADPGRVVISSEFFAGCDAAERAQVVADLGKDRLHVLLAARNPASIALSSWQQLLREGKARGLEEWLRRVYRREAPARAASGFWGKADAAVLVEKWSEVVDLDRITVLVVDESDKALLPTTFERMLGLPAGLLSSRRPAHSNRGVTAIEAEFIRQVIEGSNDEMSWEDHSVLIRGGLVRRLQDVRKPPADEPRPMMPEWAVTQAQAEADFTIQRLRDLGVRVVGDLENLRNVPAPGELGPVEQIPMDLAVEAAVGTVDSALKRFRKHEKELDREVRARRRVRNQARKKRRRQQSRPVEEIPTRELASIVRSRITGRIARQLRR